MIQGVGEAVPTARAAGRQHHRRLTLPGEQLPPEDFERFQQRVLQLILLRHRSRNNPQLANLPSPGTSLPAPCTHCVLAGLPLDIRSHARAY